MRRRAGKWLARLTYKMHRLFCTRGSGSGLLLLPFAECVCAQGHVGPHSTHAPREGPPPPTCTVCSTWCSPLPAHKQQTPHRSAIPRRPGPCVAPPTEGGWRRAWRPCPSQTSVIWGGRLQGVQHVPRLLTPGGCPHK